MKTLNIKGITSSYNVYIGTDIIDTIKRYMDAYDNILLLTNKTIGKLYINKIKKYIPKINIIVLKLKMEKIIKIWTHLWISTHLC